MAEFVKLRRPHLVLAHLRRKNRAGAGQPVQDAEHLVRRDGLFVFRLLADRIPLLRRQGPLHPFAVPAAFHPLVQRVQDPSGVAPQAEIHRDVLVEFRRVDIDLQDREIPPELLRVAGDAVGKPRAHRDEQVAAFQRRGACKASVHPEHPQVARVGLVEPALTHQGARDRGIQLFGKALQLGRRPGGDGPAARVDERAAAFRKHLHRALQLFFRGKGKLRARRKLFQRRKLAELRGHVLRDIHQHRAGAPAPRDGEGLPQGIRQLFHMLHDEIVLGDRHRDPGDVHLLKAVEAQKAEIDVPGDRDHRDRIHIGRRDPGDKIGRPGAGRRDADPRFPAGARVAVRGVRRPLLVGRLDMPDPVPVLV